MSKEFLQDVLDKFAQVTAIIVETSKIKEDLDRKCTDNKRLKDILERTKTEVENLVEHATSVNDLFNKQYEEVSQKLNIINGRDKSAGSSSDTEVINSSVTENGAVNAKPLIKLVDINKLVEPKTLLKREMVKNYASVNQTKQTRFDDTIVIITSSDDEQSTTKTTRKNQRRSAVKRKSAQEAMKKTRSAIVDSDSDSEFSDKQSNISKNSRKQKGSEINDNEISTKKTTSRDIKKQKNFGSSDEVSIKKSMDRKNTQKGGDSEICDMEELTKKTSGSKNTRKQKDSEISDAESTQKDMNNKKSTKRTPKELEKATLSDTSSLSSDSSENESSNLSTNSKNKQKHSDNKKENEKQAERIEWEKDIKFKSKCYVKVMRIPCEKLKEYYLEKLELLEINKLRDLKSLKRKRRKSASSENSSGSDGKERKSKRKPRSKTSDKKESSKEDSDTSDDLSRKNGSITPDLLENTNLDSPKQNDLEPLVEDALKLLDRDIGDDKKSSSDDDSAEENVETATKSDSQDKQDASVKKNGDAEVTANDPENSPEAAQENDKSESSSVEAAKKNSEDENSEKPDKENGKSDSPEKESSSSKTEEKGDKEDEGEGAKDEEKEKTSSDKDESGSEKKNEKSKYELSGDEDEEDEKTKKDTDKSKKQWKKDKLLTMKLSSSDSEEELKKFKKKKETMKENAESDNEPVPPQDKKKRLVKKRKKAILSDSDSDKKKDSEDETPSEKSSSSSSESEKENEKEKETEQKKSRKRVKRVRDSSEDDDEKSTRKQIRNIWGKDSLAETTKKAEAEENERKARISEKQKKYNQIYESGDNLNAKVEKVVLDFDQENSKELLRVNDDLVEKLKPHQASGLQFMWDACFESVERSKNTKGSGCILAHCMGLGKTLQVIALTHTLLTNEDTNVKKVLVVTPLNTVLNWVSEYKHWTPDEDDFEVFELVSFKQNYERQYQVKTWHDHGGVLIVGYDMFRNLSNPENKRLSRKMRTTFQEALVDPGPDLVVCDEGHLLKNEKTNISIAMNRIRTLRRIVLTGTPLQNNLKEYFCMVQFIKPNLLGTYKEYLNRFVNPITNGQYTDSTPHDIQIMRRRSHVLHKMLDGVVQRKDYSVLQPYLPPKHEYVLFLNLTEIQIKLYQHYMDHFARKSTDGTSRTSFLFVDFQNLQRICTHPRVLLDKSIEMKLAKEKRGDSEDESEGSLKDFINDDEEEESGSSSNSSSDEGKKTVPARKRVTRAAAALAKDNGEEEEEDVSIVEISEDKEWWQTYCDGEELNNLNHGTKLYLLFEILKECEQIGDKVLVFSQSLYSLNVIEYFLGRVHDATQAGDADSVAGFSGSWCHGLDYFRLDGSSSCDNRNILCKAFNDPANTRARLFLISTRAGGLGINLFAANRVIIFDVSWNPSHDIQSIYRVYRFGQTKPSYIYRFVTMGTMEMKIYERQVTKQAISKRVIDEQQIDRHYNQNDLAELYKFEPQPGDRPTPLVPNDVLLGELLQKFEDKIYKYHEHQSLLENKAEEGLNEEERKAAWEEFENEKKQRNYLGPNYMRANNIEVALASVIQEENPTWNDAQIKAMIPTLQQELQTQVQNGELTLYKKLQQKIQMLHAYQNQKLQEQYLRQQALRMLQQQQQAPNAMNRFPNAAAAGVGAGAAGWLGHYMNQMPGSSRTTHLPLPNSGIVNPTDVIDLND